MSKEEKDINEKSLQKEINELRKELTRVKACDELTGLYNKNTFYDAARNRMENNPDTKYVIACLDIEKFKFINDRFGYAEGDKLLQYIAEKLRKRASEYGTVAARFSPDLFFLLDKAEDINPEAFGAKMQRWVENYPLECDIKIAVGIYRPESMTMPVRLMCDRANMAVDTVKNNYIINVAEYNKDVRDFLVAQSELLGDVEKAFETREFKVYLQPKFDIRTNKVIGAESLVRWIHNKKGLISPKDFIPMFEQNMLITRLDAYIWEESCRLIREWIDKGYGEIPISVNVSRVDISLIDIPKKFTELTEKYNIDARLIEIEITESAFTNDETSIINIVDELRGLGFKVLMDDFGSGYSSLNILKDINVDVLKIDTRFLETGNNSDSKDKGREILESVIRMAKWIGLQTIAEGVETDEQKSFLMEQGCYYAQGFYFSKPISSEDFEKLIQNPDNVSHTTAEEDERTIAIEELFYSDYMTESLLNNILGSVVIYSYDGADSLKVLKANNQYFDLTKNREIDEENVLSCIHPNDRQTVIGALAEAKNAGVKGTVIQVRGNEDNDIKWYTVKLFYLAEKEGAGMYYASVSDSTEQMVIVDELDDANMCIETALELIDAVVVEYDFETKTLHTKTKPDRGYEFLIGEKVENASLAMLEHGIVHSSSAKTYEGMVEHLLSSKEPIEGVIDLKFRENTYISCCIRARTVYRGSKPFKVVAVIKVAQEK